MKEITLLVIGIGIGAYIMKVRQTGKDDFEKAIREEIIRREAARTSAAA